MYRFAVLICILGFFMVREHILYDLNPIKFIEMILWFRAGLTLVNILCALKRMPFSSCAGGVFCKCQVGHID